MRYGNAVVGHGREINIFQVCIHMIEAFRPIITQYMDDRFPSLETRQDQPVVGPVFRDRFPGYLFAPHIFLY